MPSAITILALRSVPFLSFSPRAEWKYWCGTCLLAGPALPPGTSLQITSPRAGGNGYLGGHVSSEPRQSYHWIWKAWVVTASFLQTSLVIQGRRLQEQVFLRGRTELPEVLAEGGRWFLQKEDTNGSLETLKEVLTAPVVLWQWLALPVRSPQWWDGCEVEGDQVSNLS